MASIDDVISIPPTLLGSSLLRGEEGTFGSSRDGGKTHQGIDIVANQSSADKSIYQVRATAAGQIAYARTNGSVAKPGYGYTVVVDHLNGFYTLYAHLAINASAGLATVGQSVQAGDIIGYLADLTNGEMSSGNARAVAPYDRIQLHFECFEAPSGRSSTGGLGAIKDGCTLDDPTLRLAALGYGSF
ncbi:M23 family metallopeptidase [Mesorhizobium sp. AR02]|uniref:murein hydrolase activator EnvC family protein n=1 Tax=Mesorhizobium sp. AR02 TaxID=2865837 RepID=UPI00215DE0B5|nr:M23 family metallopeptidase [Mesorhizobium sp. AR02]UVK55356.1 M23 family metallopeptidase [Mesorhizobium sp. AR02]